MAGEPTTDDALSLIEDAFPGELAKARASLASRDLALGRLLGASGAAVFEATRGGRRSRCVIKIFFGDSRASMAREVQMLKAIAEHPNIPSIIDEHPEMYAVLAPRGDCDLFDLVFGDFRGAADQTRAALHGAALGLAHVHRCGVVHRDVKPENIILVRARIGVLIDFDLAERRGAICERAGTRRYMAPEVAANERVLVHPSQDAWSLGRVLGDVSAAEASLAWLDERAHGMRRHPPWSRDGVERLVADLNAARERRRA